MAMSHDCPFLSTLESFSGNILFMRALLDKECSCCWFRANLLHSIALFTFFEQLCYIQCTGCKGGSPSAPNFSPHVCRKKRLSPHIAGKPIQRLRLFGTAVLILFLFFCGGLKGLSRRHGLHLTKIALLCNRKLLYICERAALSSPHQSFFLFPSSSV